MLKIAKANWVKLIADGSIVVYGIGAFIKPTKSTDGTPEIVATLFNAEFILCGILLVVGTLIGSYILKQIGLYLYIFSFLVIAALVLVGSQSIVSILLFTIALQAAVRLREMQEARKEIMEFNSMTSGFNKIDE